MVQVLVLTLSQAEIKSAREKLQTSLARKKTILVQGQKTLKKTRKFTGILLM
jgi:predicted DNA-binding protein (UPF0251 family)